MLKGTPAVAASALVLAVYAIAASGPTAIAAAPKCKNKANQCTNNLRANTQPQRPGFNAFPKLGDIKGESDSRRRLRLRAR